MAEKEIVIPVNLDAKTFRRFGWFDIFILRKRWIRPAVFAAILAGFAVAALMSGRNERLLIAGVLLAVGLGLPLVYTGTFMAQMRAQAERQRLPRKVYTVRLDFDGVRVTNDQRKEDAQFVKWQDVPAAFRKKGCIYLYVAANRAYLLPSGQASVSDDELWDCLKARLGEKCR